MPGTMFIISSNMFCSPEYLDAMNPLLIFGESRLVAIREKKWADLKRDIIELVKAHKPLAVYIGGHLEPCFKKVGVICQMRFSAYEDELKRELGDDKLKISVWGFRHEPGC